MAFNQCVYLSYRRTRQFTAAPVSATVSVSNVHSALMNTKLLFPDKRSRFNERRTHANLHTFVAIIAAISASHDKNQIHVHNHARVHIDCERVCDHWAFPSTFSKRESLFVNPYTNTTKTHSLFNVISSWRLLNQENARVCATWGTSTQCPCIYFLITGSEHDETIWACAYHKYDQILSGSHDAH